MLLKEIFSDDYSDVHVNWVGDMGTFTINDYTYYLQFMKLYEQDWIHGSAPLGAPMSDNTYFIGFAAQNNRTRQMTDDITNSGDSIKVFSVIIQEIQKRVEHTRADILYFGTVAGSKKERLYRTLIRKYTADGNWRVFLQYQARYVGHQQQVWVLVRD